MPLRQLASHLRIPTEGPQLFQVLTGLIKHAYPKIQETELLEILRKRVACKGSELSELLATPEIEEGLTAAEQAEQRAWAESAATAETAQDGPSYRKAVFELQARLATAKGKKGARAGGSAKGATAKGAWQGPSKFEPKENMSAREAQPYFPFQARVFRDSWSMRWTAFWPGRGSISRSFQLYGEVGALTLCCRWAWELSATLHDQPCPFEGLL